MTPTFPVKPAEQRVTEPRVIGPLEPRQLIEPGGAPPVATGTRRGSGGLPPLEGAMAEGLDLEQIALPIFINEVFAKALKLTVQMDPAVASRSDMVTLRSGGVLPARELFGMGQKVLAGYGVALDWDGTVLHVLPDSGMAAQMPDLIRSRALPDLPVAMRPIFQVIDLRQVAAQDVIATLTNAYGTKVKLFSAARSNTIMIFGLPENVRAAVEAVQLLDQARLAGRQSLRISPIYWTAQKLANKLAELLRAEGYDAAAGGAGASAPDSAIVIVPVETNNSIIVFAADAAVLSHIRQWGSDLDQPGKADPSRSVFVYSVNNTTAVSLGRTVQNVLGSGQAAPDLGEAKLDQAGRTGLPDAKPSQMGGPAVARSLAAADPPPQQMTATPAGESHGGPRVVIDTARNALLFVGTAQDYESIRPVLEALDKPPRQALIEVTVAEVTLTDTTNLGVEWGLLNRLGSGLVGQAGTTAIAAATAGNAPAVTGIALGSSGFNYTILNRANDVRFILNALAENNAIRVISTPRVLAESGSSANIDVGTEVPIVTSQGTTNQVQVGGTSGILQSIEYQKTGVLLSVTPVVHSGDRIDLMVSQEVSQALPNTTSGISSPLIQNRNVSTRLTLSDGATVVIGGLISENLTNDDTGVPLLKDIPGVGQLFRNQSIQKIRQELLVFITPYVISGDTDAASITRTFQDQMKAWPAVSAELHW